MSDPTPTPDTAASGAYRAVGGHDSPTEVLRRALSRLTEEAFSAARAKCYDLGFDMNRGPFSFDEAIAELSGVRSILSDAIDKRKFMALPFKIQQEIAAQGSTVAGLLASLSSGADAVLNFESAVHDLVASVWMSQVQGQTGHLLGFQSKMNQLKKQEAVLREALSVRDELSAMRDRAKSLLAAIVDHDEALVSANASARVSRFRSTRTSVS
jgi:hypothetical protein